MWYSDDFLETKNILFDGGNRVFSKRSPDKEAHKRPQKHPSHEIASHGDKSIARFVFDRLRLTYPDQYEKRTVFLSTKTCLSQIKSIFGTTYGAIAHHLAPMPGNPPTTYWHEKVFMLEFGRFQIRQNKTSPHQSPSYRIHFKSFGRFADVIQ